MNEVLAHVKQLVALSVRPPLKNSAEERTEAFTSSEDQPDPVQQTD